MPLRFYAFVLCFFNGKIAKMYSPGRLVFNNMSPSKMTLIICRNRKQLLFKHSFVFELLKYHNKI